MMPLSVLTLNVANPSPDRAERQLPWLAGRDEHVLVLTETKASQGCALLADAFRTAGYTVFDSHPGPGEYGVMIVARVRAEPDHLTQGLGYLPSRAASCLLPTPDGPVRVVGLMCPPGTPASRKRSGSAAGWPSSAPCSPVPMGSIPWC